jgi:hypothetical protein
VLGEAPLALLREDDRAVDDDVELALLAGSDAGLDPVPFVQLGCETRSPSVVAASDGAEEDLDALHGESLVRGRRAPRTGCTPCG